MRFRRKPGLLDWLLPAIACLLAVFWLTGKDPGLRQAVAFYAIVFFALASLQFVSRILVYWDLDAGCLRERRLWIKKEIEWEKVTHVGKYIPRAPADNTLRVSYVSSESKSGHAFILAKPRHREQFITTLRTLATQAKFDV
jgi:hypothetical protein